MLYVIIEKMIKNYEDLLKIYPKNLAIILDMLNKEIGFNMEVYATLKEGTTDRYNVHFDIEITNRSRNQYTFYDYVILDSAGCHKYRIAFVRLFMEYFDDLFKYYNLKPTASFRQEGEELKFI